MGKCKLCEKQTENVFNIDLKPVFICEECANQVMLQQVKDLIRKRSIDEA